MGVLLAFAPFIVFFIADRLIGPGIALFAGAAASAFLLLRDLITPGRTPKILEIGTFLLFSGLAVFQQFAQPGWTVIGVRLQVDAGLLVIVLVSLVLRRPFTLQYAHERVPPETWNSPDFIRVNYVITAAWALAFAVMVVAEAAILYVPGLPQRVGMFAVIIALVGAVKFTNWYPDKIARNR